MNVPSYRRRFVSSKEDKFRIQGSAQHQGLINPEPGVLYSPPVVAAEKEDDGSAAPHLKLPDPVPEAVTKDSPPVRPPSNAHLLRTWATPPRARPVVFTWRAALLFALAGLALGGFGGVWWTRATGRPAASGARGQFLGDVKTLTPEETAALDAAYAARHAEKFAQAEQLFTSLALQHPQWGGVSVEVGRTLLYQKKVPEAQAALTAAVNRGLEPADAHFLLGALAVMHKTYADAEAQLATAVAFDPTRADFYYLWGDCLRREGKPRDAAAKFHAAILRNQYETADGLYRLKFWLSEIEADQDRTDGTGAEIDAALAQAHPPMEAFFAAAARDFRAGDIAGAVGHLTRGRVGVEPSVFVVIMRDPIFVQECMRPELAEFYPPPAPLAKPPATPPASGQIGAEPPASPSPTVQAAASPADKATQ